MMSVWIVRSIWLEKNIKKANKARKISQKARKNGILTSRPLFTICPEIAHNQARKVRTKSAEYPKKELLYYYCNVINIKKQRRKI